MAHDTQSSALTHLDFADVDIAGIERDLGCLLKIYRNIPTWNGAGFLITPHVTFKDANGDVQEFEKKDQWPELVNRICDRSGYPFSESDRQVLSGPNGPKLVPGFAQAMIDIFELPESSPKSLLLGYLKDVEFRAKRNSRPSREEPAGHADNPQSHALNVTTTRRGGGRSA